MEHRQKLYILYGFILFFCIDLVAIWVASSVDAISRDSRNVLVLKVGSIYSPHVGLICGSLFIKGPSRKAFPATLFATVLLFCCIWNLLTVIPMVQLVVDAFGRTSGGLTQLTDFLDSYPTWSACLVTGMLGYLFCK